MDLVLGRGLALPPDAAEEALLRGPGGGGGGGGDDPGSWRGLEAHMRWAQQQRCSAGVTHVMCGRCTVQVFWCRRADIASTSRSIAQMGVEHSCRVCCCASQFK